MGGETLIEGERDALSALELMGLSMFDTLWLSALPFRPLFSLLCFLAFLLSSS